MMPVQNILKVDSSLETKETDRISFYLLISHIKKHPKACALGCFYLYDSDNEKIVIDFLNSDVKFSLRYCLKSSRFLTRL